MMRRIVVIAVMICVAAPVSAHAVCRFPSLPTGEPIKPIAPLCVDLDSNTHTCSEAEIARYYDKVNRYNDAADAYVKKLNAYVDDAVKYRECKIEGLR